MAPRSDDEPVRLPSCPAITYVDEGEYQDLEAQYGQETSGRRFDPAHYCETQAEHPGPHTAWVHDFGMDVHVFVEWELDAEGQETARRFRTDGHCPAGAGEEVICLFRLSHWGAHSYDTPWESKPRTPGSRRSAWFPIPRSTR